MKVSEFEDKVWEIDRIRLVLRAPENQAVDAYDWQKAADQGLSIKEYIEIRITPKIRGIEAVIIDGDGEEPNRRTLLRTARESYKR